MGDIVKNNTKVAVEVEVTEGTYVAPTGASSFFQTLSDGFEMTPAKEQVERNVFIGSVGKVSPRTSTRSVSGSIPVELKPLSTAGDAPEFDELMRSALGTKRQIASAITTKVGNTASQLEIEDADIGDLQIGDCILVKESGAYHVSPISARDPSAGTANVTLLIPAGGAFSNNVEIEKCTTYTVAESAHPALSITKYLEDAIREAAIGCKITSLSIENFATGQIPTANFSYEGLDFSRAIAAPAYTPSYDTGLPPLALGGAIYQDTTAIPINELTLSIENTLGYKSSIAAENGRIASRVTGRSISGTINPYKQDDDISDYTKFRNNTEFSLFAYIKNDSSTPGEFSNVVALYLPKCMPMELTEADQDGLVQETISFTSSRGEDGSSNEIYMSFI